MKEVLRVTFAVEWCHPTIIFLLNISFSSDSLQSLNESG